jgi:hypothetical protein
MQVARVRHYCSLRVTTTQTAMRNRTTAAKDLAELWSFGIKPRRDSQNPADSLPTLVAWVVAERGRNAPVESAESLRACPDFVQGGQGERRGC